MFVMWVADFQYNMNLCQHLLTISDMLNFTTPTGLRDFYIKSKVMLSYLLQPVYRGSFTGGNLKKIIPQKMVEIKAVITFHCR